MSSMYTKMGKRRKTNQLNRWKDNKQVTLDRTKELPLKVCVYNRSAFCDNRMACLHLPKEVPKIPIQGLFSEIENRVNMEFEGDMDKLIESVSQRLRYFSTLNFSCLSLEELAYTNFLISEYCIAFYFKRVASHYILFASGIIFPFPKYTLATRIIQQSAKAMSHIRGTDRTHEDENYFIGKANVAKYFANEMMKGLLKAKAAGGGKLKKEGILGRDYLGIALQSLEHSYITLDHMRIYMEYEMGRLSGDLNLGINYDFKPMDLYPLSNQLMRIASEMKRQGSDPPAKIDNSYRFNELMKEQVHLTSVQRIRDSIRKWSTMPISRPMCTLFGLDRMFMFLEKFNNLTVKDNYSDASDIIINEVMHSFRKSPLGKIMLSYFPDDILNILTEQDIEYPSSDPEGSSSTQLSSKSRVRLRKKIRVHRTHQNRRKPIDCKDMRSVSRDTIGLLRDHEASIRSIIGHVIERSEKKCDICRGRRVLMNVDMAEFKVFFESNVEKYLGNFGDTDDQYSDDEQLSDTPVTLDETQKASDINEYALESAHIGFSDIDSSATKYRGRAPTPESSMSDTPSHDSSDLWIPDIE